MPHAYYQVLAMLSEAPGRTLRMSELAAATTSSPSRLSHAVARLEEKGWYAGTGTRPTAAVAGRPDRRGSMRSSPPRPGHVEAVREALFDRLTPTQAPRCATPFRTLAGDGIADRTRPRG